MPDVDALAIPAAPASDPTGIVEQSDEVRALEEAWTLGPLTLRSVLERPRYPNECHVFDVPCLVPGRARRAFLWT